MDTDTQNLGDSATVGEDSIGPSESSAPLARGTAVSRYIIAELIGRGGMGVVYKAFDPELNRTVALKLLLIERSSNDSSLDYSRHQSRLLREAQALAQLSHPNVVTVYDVGTHGPAVFMALEFVEGQTFADYLDDGSHSRGEILAILAAAGRGLVAAHQIGIIHRDFKPANILIGKDGRVRVIDFGLARGTGAEGPERPAAESDKTAEKIAGADGQVIDEKLPATVRLSEQVELSTRRLSGSLLSAALTQWGAIVGTPHYMAAEQHLGQAVDEKSDQFSFCVVLFEALYGARPFPGQSRQELRKSIIQRDIRRPDQVEVPAWLDRIADRGMLVDPVERYPSMDALLNDLENDPAIARARRRGTQLRWLLVGLVVLFAGLATYGIWYGTNQGARLCRGGAEKLVGVWDHSLKTKARKAFSKTARPYAQDTFERVAKVLDRYTEQWVIMRREACEATHVRGEQSGELLDLRMQCLRRRLSETRALTTLFATKPDAELVDNAVQASMGLIPLSQCADERALLAEVPPPEKPGERKQVAEIRNLLNQAEALGDTGRIQDGLLLIREALVATEKIDYKPIKAEAWYLKGSLLEGMGKYPAAEQSLWQSVKTADASGDDKQRAMALNDLIYVVGYHRAQFDQAKKIIERAGLVVERIKNEGEIKAIWLSNTGVVYDSNGEYDLALEHHQKALAIREKAQGPNHPDVAASCNNIGIVYLAKAEYDRAIEHHQRALVIWENLLGPEHPNVAACHNNMGIAFYQKGENDRAHQHHERALHIFEKVLGPDHPTAAYPLNNIGLVLLMEGKLHRSLRHFERALTIWEKSLGPKHPLLTEPLRGIGWISLYQNDLVRAQQLFERVLSICGSNKCLGEEQESLADAQFGLATVLDKEGRDRKRALSLAQSALTFFQTQKSIPGKKMLAKAKSWIKEHGSER